MLKNFLKFSLGAVAIIAFGAALYFAASYYKEWRDKNNVVQQQKPDEIIITELPNGEKLVENKTEGVSVKIPSVWKIEKPTSSQTPVTFYSQSLASDKNIVCAIENYVSDKGIEDVEKFKKEQDDSIREVQIIIKSEYANLVINGYPALKHFLETDTNTITREAIIMTPNKTYSFIVYDLSTNRDKCYKEVEFDKFLQTISIK